MQRNSKTRRIGVLMLLVLALFLAHPGHAYARGNGMMTRLGVYLSNPWFIAKLIASAIVIPDSIHNRGRYPQEFYDCLEETTAADPDLYPEGDWFLCKQLYPPSSGAGGPTPPIVEPPPDIDPL